jgi:chromosome segregation ATPase
MRSQQMIQNIEALTARFEQQRTELQTDMRRLTVEKDNIIVQLKKQLEDRDNDMAHWGHEQQQIANKTIEERDATIQDLETQIEQLHDQHLHHVKDAEARAEEQRGAKDTDIKVCIADTSFQLV